LRLALSGRTADLLAGENLKKVSAALGHSRIATTADTYAHVVEALDAESSGRLESLLFSPSDSQVLSGGVVTETAGARRA